MEASDGLRRLEKEWDFFIVAAAMIVSFLGTFTSTQLMIQARLSAKISTVITWIVLISLTFGLCSTWSLHFVGMLACKLDLPIGLNVGLSLFSAVLAFLFTFIAIGSDLLWQRYKPIKKPKEPKNYASHVEDSSRLEPYSMPEESTVPLLGSHWMAEAQRSETVDHEAIDDVEYGQPPREFPIKTLIHPSTTFPDHTHFGIPVEDVDREHEFSRSAPLEHVSTSESPYHSSRVPSIDGPRLDDLKSMAFQGNSLSRNAFTATYEGLYNGMSWKAVAMGLVWSLAITCMHYGGIAAMHIPGGFLTLYPPLVALSAAIAWVVCIVGYIYMVNIESHLTQQILFSIVAAFGIAAMHFTGMKATTFWSQEPPSELRGYPAQLLIAVCSVAILTCMLANGLLAHNATVSRNKLAEIVWTRRKLWRTMAQKENAEAAAAARSSFIATASHEIRTPLHHLQGYSDLLSRTELNEEGRQLLLSIQRAIKTLSLITNNVLDWSKLESDKDASCRPTSLDIRSVCESILVLLPNKDDEAEVEVMVVISPNVPKILFLDETYINRILMNLLSNSLKFTRSGYVMLSLEMDGTDLEIKVKDTGIGIPPSFLKHLFEPFSQAQTRGSQRGTGLGLSIVKKLVHKMEGTIDVESSHAEQGYEPDETGTTSVVTIPALASSLSSSPRSDIQPTKNTIAILRPTNARILEGLKIAWELFGYETIIVDSIEDIPDSNIKYVWADFRFLQQTPDGLRRLMNQEKWTALIPFDNQETLQRLPGLLSTPHFVPLQRPLTWHTFDSRIALASHSTPNHSFSRSVRFASDSVTADDAATPSPDGTVSKNVHILLVEDNPINQKLGNKMLTSLGYSVLLASDGDEAISQVLLHDTTIEMILMDQCMPIKDGVTATREIRELEEQGKMKRRHRIIALTAVVGTESRAQFREAGADEFLAKPLSMGKLEQTLATFLRVE